MHDLNKNSYLQERCSGINPRILNRCIEKARQLIRFNAYDIAPPVQRLASSYPCIPIQNIDVTRRPLAFGRLQIPKLIRELHDEDPVIALQAITSLTDVLHDPEKGYEAIKLKITDRMVDLMKHDNKAMRERIYICLTVIAGLSDGRMAILKRPMIIRNLLDALSDDELAVRLQVAICLEMIARFWVAADVLVDNGFVSALLDNLLNDDVSVIIVHLETLRFLMYCNGKRIAIDNEGFIADLLNSDNPQIQAGAASCLAELLSLADVKETAYKEKLLKSLNKLIYSEDTEVQENTAAALMFCSVLTKAKFKTAKLANLPERLIELSQNPLNRGLQIYCFKALTNICEHPRVRKLVADNYLDKIKKIEVHAGSPQERYKKTLLGVINWLPTIG